MYTNDFCLSSKQKNSRFNSQSPLEKEGDESMNVTIYKNKNSSRKK
jgi:hypothetical protein